VLEPHSVGELGDARVLLLAKFQRCSHVKYKWKK